MKKKIGDLTLKEAKEMQDKICNIVVCCEDCPFTHCCINDSIDLDQEIDVEENDEADKNGIAQIYTIKQEPKQLSDFVYTIQEKYISQCVASFDEFCIDELYKYYQQLGFTRIFVVNRTEFKKFILWALPLWKNRGENNE